MKFNFASHSLSQSRDLRRIQIFPKMSKRRYLYLSRSSYPKRTKWQAFFNSDVIYERCQRANCKVVDKLSFTPNVWPRHSIGISPIACESEQRNSRRPETLGETFSTESYIRVSVLAWSFCSHGTPPLVKIFPMKLPDRYIRAFLRVPAVETAPTAQSFRMQSVAFFFLFIYSENRGEAFRA